MQQSQLGRSEESSGHLALGSFAFIGKRSCCQAHVERYSGARGFPLVTCAHRDKKQHHRPEAREVAGEPRLTGGNQAGTVDLL